MGNIVDIGFCGIDQCYQSDEDKFKYFVKGKSIFVKHYSLGCDSNLDFIIKYWKKCDYNRIYYAEDLIAQNDCKNKY